MKKLIFGFFKSAILAVKEYVPLILKNTIRLFSIKRLIIIAAIIGIATLIYLGLGGGLGGGKGEGKGDGNTNNPTVEQEKVEDKKDGNEDDYKGAIFAVTVAGNDYFFQNERVQLEELINNLEEVEESFVVEIKDDNASLKAYTTLIDRLDILNIRYIEK